MKRRGLGWRLRLLLVASIASLVFIEVGTGTNSTSRLYPAFVSPASRSQDSRSEDVSNHETICSTSSVIFEESETSPQSYMRANNETSKTEFAYAFTVAACTIESCQPYVLNAIVASTILKHYNSNADVVFVVRMASKKAGDDPTKITQLSCQQEYWLRQAGIKLYYLPNVKIDNFGTVSLEKFRVLEMTKYDRVYFLDADLIPLCNIDYHMELSIMGRLQNYVGMQGSREPINAGSFIVTPRHGLFENVMDIVHRHRKKEREPTILSPVEGWGHEIEDNDRWVASGTNGLLWNFHGFQVDQGLLYYWLKYEVLNWSHILENGEVDTWAEVTSNVNYWRNRTNVVGLADGKYIGIVNKSKSDDFRICGSLHGRDPSELHGLALDTYHYKGKDKPWLQPIHANEIPPTYTTDLQGRDVWLYWLGQANRTLNLRIPNVLEVHGRGPTMLDWTSDRNMLLNPTVEIPVPVL
eukprot:scaffold1727_cov133-Cylindrotheca_fusiformis.AAC.55